MSSQNPRIPVAALAVLAALGGACSSNPDSPAETGGSSSVSKDEGGAGGKSGGAAAGAVTKGSGGSTETAGGNNQRGGSSTESGGAASGGAKSGTGGQPSAGAGGASGGKAGKGGAQNAGGTVSGAGGKGILGPDASAAGKAGKGGAPDAGPAAAGGTTGAGGSNADAGGTGGGAKSAGCGKTPSLKSGNGQTISISGSNRTYNLKVPDNYDNNHPYRLMMSYHWMGGTANDVSNGNGTIKPFYGLWDLAAGSTIFVAPQGTSNQWTNSNGVDVEFSRQLIAKMEDEFCVDTSRIFCEGFSMGGSMSYAMACAMPDTIRAVAVHSGGPMSGCVSHTKPIPYFMTHGTKDSVCTYPSYGVPQLQDFAKVDGCTKPDPGLSATAFEAALPEPTSTASACVQFEGCKEGYPVRACLFVGDHTPSPDGSNGWVPKETWQFLSQF